MCLEEIATHNLAFLDFPGLRDHQYFTADNEDFNEEQRCLLSCPYFSNEMLMNIIASLSLISVGKEGGECILTTNTSRSVSVYLRALVFFPLCRLSLSSPHPNFCAFLTQQNVKGAQ